MLPVLAHAVTLTRLLLSTASLFSKPLSGMVGKGIALEPRVKPMVIVPFLCPCCKYLSSSIQEAGHRVAVGALDLVSA